VQLLLTILILRAERLLAEMPLAEQGFRHVTAAYRWLNRSG
jgi:hypothetical protein